MVDDNPYNPPEEGGPAAEDADARVRSHARAIGYLVSFATLLAGMVYAATYTDDLFVGIPESTILALLVFAATYFSCKRLLN